MTKKVFVCGGAGYIGSHIVKEFTRLHNYQVIIVDNFSKGHKESIPKNVTVEEGDIRDKNFLDAAFSKHKPDAVMHLCASIVVPESVADPLSYYENNVSGTITLLQAMNKHSVKYFIFSSTAALFGLPEVIPIKENDVKNPINPYGDTKLACETMLKWCDEAYGMKYVCLRYFNACGADADGDIGEDHTPETHLIPLVLEVPLGKKDKCFIYGEDYDTPDRTCIRDYIHVTDLATAHIKALEYLMKENVSNNFNLGSGRGFSVKEVVEACRKVTGHPIPVELHDRRAGDPAILIAASEKCEQVLQWERKYKTIESTQSNSVNGPGRFPVSQDRVNQVLQMFPNFSSQAIELDLSRTGSVELTIDNIINGRIRATAPQFFTTTASNNNNNTSISQNKASSPLLEKIDFNSLPSTEPEKVWESTAKEREDKLKQRKLFMLKQQR
ncbi:hypothetical protein HK099_007804, partial [Clydaea vesicula]